MALIGLTLFKGRRMLIMSAKQIWWFLGEGGCGSFLLAVFISDSDKCRKFLSALSRHENGKILIVEAFTDEKS